MLYLVNRSILKDQIENEINNLEYKSRQAITVWLYQTIENNYYNYDGSENASFINLFEQYHCLFG